MSFFSGSSKRKPYRNGHYGSNHYQRRGILGNLFNVFGSRSSRDYYHYPEQYPNQQNPNIPTQGMACPKCQKQIQAGSKFCPQCGEKVNEGLFCTACGEKALPGAKFCSNCGTRING